MRRRTTRPRPLAGGSMVNIREPLLWDGAQSRQPDNRPPSAFSGQSKGSTNTIANSGEIIKFSFRVRTRLRVVSLRNEKKGPDSPKAMAGQARLLSAGTEACINTMAAIQ